MYAGSDRDAVYQAALAQKQRESRSALTQVFNSLTNSTNTRATGQSSANTTNGAQTNSRTTANNANRSTRTNQNTRRQ